jgi:hypothetical protein
VPNECAHAVLKTFQRDQLFTRVRVARAYAKMLDSSHAPISLNSDEMMKVSVAVHGFGPHFLMVVYLRTMSVQVCGSQRVCVPLGSGHYWCVFVIRLQHTAVSSGEEHDCVCPARAWHRVYVRNKSHMHAAGHGCADARTCARIHGSGMSDDVRCMVMKDDRAVPCITAQVAMPVSEQSLID